MALLPLAGLALQYRCDAAAVAAHVGEELDAGSCVAAKEGQVEKATGGAESSLDSVATAAERRERRPASSTLAPAMTRRESYFPSTPLPFQDTLARATSEA